MEYLIRYQLDVMLLLGCACGLQAVSCLIMDLRSVVKKRSLAIVEIGAMFLLLADRYAYIYRGNETMLGYWMVNITNFAVFIMYYVIIAGFARFVLASVESMEENEKVVRILKLIFPLLIAGVFLIIVSQFTGLYYTIDRHNLYHRSKGFIISYIIPTLIIVLLVLALFQLRKKTRRMIYWSLMLFVVLPMAAAILQILEYGTSLINISVGLSAAIMYYLAIIDQNKELSDQRTALIEANEKEVAYLKELNTVSRDQFRQIVLALSNAIDAKDKYTHGHSRRVAEYSRMLAEAAGKSEKECEEVYFAALLHDVGKIGVPDEILTKEGKLTEDEFHAITEHPGLGNQILAEINGSPYLSIGAHYHHERYDGKGYPDRLKGKDIPDLARIIAVADAYDAMTSSRSYRKPLAQQKVREELVKGAGTQFDPEYARSMIHFLDKDTDYRLKDDVFRYNGVHKEVVCDSDNQDYSGGIEIEERITTIRFEYKKLGAEPDCGPAILVFDSLDERVYTDERYKKEMEYSDFFRIDFNGEVTAYDIRTYQVKEIPVEKGEETRKNQLTIQTLKQRDHILIRVIYPDVIREYTLAMFDRSHFAFVSLTGKQCKISNIIVQREKDVCEAGYITRIAKEVSYINGPVGDIANLEIAGWREKHSVGIPIKSGMTIDFDARSLPAARRLWHCPIVTIFYAEDGMVNGPGFRELAVIRFDGESWEEDTASKNRMYLSIGEEFGDWESWKRANHEGVHCHVSVERTEDTITFKGEDHGIGMLNITELLEDFPGLYLAISGDQVAITNIRIHYPR